MASSLSTSSSSVAAASKEIVNELTTNEKIRLLSGSGIWTLPTIPTRFARRNQNANANANANANTSTAFTVSDGPHGVRKPLSDLSLQQSHPATCFPAGCALGCSWDVDIFKQVGHALANECRHYNIQTLLGPAMNLKRHPAGGRNLEYISEDPLLSGKCAAAYVRGVQTRSQQHPHANQNNSTNVGACVKHFAVNNQESHRMVVNVIVDERTLRELYLRNFEIAVKESKPCMVMGAYNQMNGTYCCEHEHLLTTILRDEWKYHEAGGICVTDWGASHNRAKAIAAGMDLEMPGNRGVFDRELVQALQDGSLTMESVDACAQRIIELLLNQEQNEQHQQNQHDVSETPHSRLSSDDRLFQENHKVAYNAAMECVVLLKNEGHILPLQDPNVSTTRKTHRISIIGAFAKESRYQGMGSSHVTPTQVDHAYDAFAKYGYSSNTVSNENVDGNCNLFYARGYDPNADDNDESIQNDLIDQAKLVARQGDVIVLFLGLPEILESEGFDREHLRLPKQQVVLLQALLDDLDEVNIQLGLEKKKIIAVLSGGGEIDLPDCIDQVPAVLEGYLLGQAGGTAIVDLLFGKASPSGKLAETFPLRQRDVLADSYFPGTRDAVEYREGLNVGYRYFDSAHQQQGDTENLISVRFPFGHGLSYTRFDYSNLQLNILLDTEQVKHVQLSFRLKNIGSMAAKEVVQCYVGAALDSFVYRPAHELCDFSKILLQPGESKDITVTLKTRTFAFYDIGVKDWIVEPGRYEIQVGSSSRDIRLSQTFEFVTGKSSSTLARESYPPAIVLADAPKINDETFANRFGQEKGKVLDQIRQRFMEPRRPIVEQLHRNSLLKEVATFSTLGSILSWIVFRVACLEVPSGPTQKRQIHMVKVNVENLPLRTLVLFSKGGLSFEFLEALLAVMNGKVTSALVGFCFMIWCSIVGRVSRIFVRRP